MLLVINTDVARAVPSPRGVLLGLCPQTILQATPNWNMKHYKLVEFWSLLNVKPPLHERKAPLHPYWRLSGDGSEVGDTRAMPIQIRNCWYININSNNLPFTLIFILLFCWNTFIKNVVSRLTENDISITPLHWGAQHLGLALSPAAARAGPDVH